MAYPSSREICEKSDEIHRETAYLQIRSAYIGGLTFQRAVHAHGALVVAEHAGIAPFVAAGVDQFPDLRSPPISPDLWSIVCLVRPF